MVDGPQISYKEARDRGTMYPMRVVVRGVRGRAWMTAPEELVYAHLSVRCRVRPRGPALEVGARSKHAALLAAEFLAEYVDGRVVGGVTGRGASWTARVEV